MVQLTVEGVICLSLWQVLLRISTQGASISIFGGARMDGCMAAFNFLNDAVFFPGTLL